jgi:hypothetical protein
MSQLKKEVVYFKEKGKENTDALLNSVKEYIEKEKIEDIVVASTTGETGAKAPRIFKGLNTVVVTHYSGFQKPEKNSSTRRV